MGSVQKAKNRTKAQYFQISSVIRERGIDSTLPPFGTISFITPYVSTAYEGRRTSNSALTHDIDTKLRGIPRCGMTTDIS